MEPDMQPSLCPPAGEPVAGPDCAGTSAVPPGRHIMRGLCERALAAWNGVRYPGFDYAWRVQQLLEEWDRLLPTDDLPRKIREYVVRDRPDARRVVEALLRRLDRIDGE